MKTCKISRTSKYVALSILAVFFVLSVASMFVFALAPIAKADGDSFETSQTLYDLTIYYKIKNTDTEIHPKLHITDLEGASYSYVSPEISKYVLVYEEDAVISGKLTGNTVRNVYYESVDDVVPYFVNYYTMEVDGSNLTLIDQTRGEAAANTIVRVDIFNVPGYSWDVCDLLLTVTADGKATKNVYYIKSDGEYSIVVRTGTGYARTIKARTGDDITAQIRDIFQNPPTRVGYEFVEWDNKLLAQGVAENKTILMTDHDVIISAVWKEATEAPYRVEFWFENLADDNYTKNGAFDSVRYGRVGARVKASDDDKLLADENALYPGGESETDPDKLLLADDLEYIFYKYNLPVCANYLQYRRTPFFGFDYNDELTETQTIAADGSAVLKVYFKRELWSHLVYKTTSVPGENDTIIEKLSTRNAKFGAELKFTNMPTSELAAEFDLDENVYFYNLAGLGNSASMNKNVAESYLKSHTAIRYASINTVRPVRTTINIFMYEANPGEDGPGIDLDEKNHNLVYCETKGHNGIKSVVTTLSRNLILGDTYYNGFCRYATSKEGLKNASWIQIQHYATMSASGDLVVATYNRDDDVGYINLVLRLRSTIVNGTLYGNLAEEDKPANMYFEIWCPREKNTVTYVPGREIVGDSPSTLSLGHGESFSYMFDNSDELMPEYVLQERGTDYSMEGWYFDANFTNKVTPQSTMPMASVTMYAKWIPNFATVTFDSMGGTPVATKVVRYGETLSQEGLSPTKPNFEFVGWYDVDGKLFNFSQELSQDVALHAVWKPNLSVGYTVYHVLVNDDDTTEVLGQFTVDAFGKAGEYVTVKALGATGWSTRACETMQTCTNPRLFLPPMLCLLRNLH